MDSNSEALGIYVSVPFCRAKCSFCNFASGVSGPAAIDAYVKQLCAEIDVAAETALRLGARLPRQVDSVYFGGGTPSLLTPSQLGEIFAAVGRGFVVDDRAEITLEAAPGQIADEVLDAGMRLGVNRVSLGVQSFVDRESAAVGRTHTEQECVAEVARLRAAGLQEVGADLIAGLPYQTRESFAYSLDVAVSVGLTHLSVYMLEVDEDSRLGREVLGGGLRLHAPKVPGEEMSAELYEMACAALPRAGFAQYEVSNFAGAGHQSRHNRKYWERKPYMGFGLDAHSMLLTDEGAVRFANADELKNYDADSRDVSRVGEREAFEEKIFLGLRLSEGVCVQTLPAEFAALVEPAVRELVEGGLMSCDGGRWILTLRGRMVSNEVFGRVLEALDAVAV
jgi:oxygen-independent coproporphyrinogen III oxidase